MRKQLILCLGALILSSFVTAHARRIPYREPPPVASCIMPAAGADDRVIVYADDIDAISNVTVAGQDEVTFYTRIEIEPGFQRLYFILPTSHPTIFEFTGATHRVSHVAMIAAPRFMNAAVPPVGAVGLRAQRVSVHHACAGYLDYFSRRWESSAREEFAAVVGVPVTDVTQTEHVYSTAFPSRVTTPYTARTQRPARVPEEVWTQHRRFYRGDLPDINPRNVVGARAERYDILPNQWGLVQLLENGTLRYMGGEPFHGVYRVERPMARYPAGLHGAHRVLFDLPAGMPAPEGDPGAACVLFANGAHAGYCPPSDIEELRRASGGGR
jgi:hypothetical protein